jgi:hypothetical protein
MALSGDSISSKSIISLDATMERTDLHFVLAGLDFFLLKIISHRALSLVRILPRVPCAFVLGDIGFLSMEFSFNAEDLHRSRPFSPFFLLNLVESVEKYLLAQFVSLSGS